MEELFSSFLRRAGMPASALLSCFIVCNIVMNEQIIIFLMHVCVLHSDCCPIQWFFITLWMPGISHATAEATNTFHNAKYACFSFTAIQNKEFLWCQKKAF